MKTNRIFAFLLAALLLLPAAGSFAQRHQLAIQVVEIFDLHGDNFGPHPRGINRRGYIVGEAQNIDNNFAVQGFVRSPSGRSSALIYPGGSISTYADDVNATGTICGFYRDSASITHGWFLTDGVYSTFDIPGAVRTSLSGINDAGDFVGVYSTNGTDSQAFLDSDGSVIPIDLGFATNFTTPTAISSNGLIAGNYRLAVGEPVNGFIRAADGTVTTGIQDPEPGTEETFCQGINSRSWVVGFYSTEFDVNGFLFVPPNHFINYSQLNAKTFLNGINDRGRITGYYVTSDGIAHGLVLQVVEQ